MKSLFVNIDYNNFKPAVPRKYLLIISGLLWTFVGIFLSSLAYHWLLNYHDIAIYYILGFALALTIHSFGFIKIAKKNVNRILNMKKKRVWLLAFQPFKSYIIIAIMMTLGILLRHSAIPKNYLAIMYLGIGGALFLSSLKYYGIYMTNFKIEVQQ